MTDLPDPADARPDGASRAGRNAPIAGRGQRIGLLGGSFDPPHEGHVHLSDTALRSFGLDAVWWLVSPANPLKREGPAPLERRMAAAGALATCPRVRVTDIEVRLGTRATVDTLAALRAIYPTVRFVWLMGADNLAQIHRWDRWPAIFHQVPVGVVARPGDPIWARTAHAARRFRRHRLRAADARALPMAPPPSWCYLPTKMVDASSTAIRARGDWLR